MREGERRKREVTLINRAIWGWTRNGAKEGAGIGIKGGDKASR